MPAGRPRKIESPEAFERITEAYFAQREAEEVRPTVTGLVLALGLSSYESLDEYGRRPEYSELVSRAKLRVADKCEIAAIGNGSPQGAMFILKNIKAGADQSYWKDKQEVEFSGELKNMTDEQIQTELSRLMDKN